jgi:hypothetical protein
MKHGFRHENLTRHGHRHVDTDNLKNIGHQHRYIYLSFIIIKYNNNNNTNGKTSKLINIYLF